MYISPALGPQALCPSLELVTATNSLCICADMTVPAGRALGWGPFYGLYCGLQCVLLKTLLT